MAPPPKLDYAQDIYLHITAPTAPPTQTLSIPPSTSSSSSSASSAATAFREAYKLEYVGPVGELQGEYIYAVRPIVDSQYATTPSVVSPAASATPAAPSAPPHTSNTATLPAQAAISSLKGDSGRLTAITAEVKKLDGVQGARILQEKQRAKR